MDVEAGAGASWSGASWEPVDVAARHHEVEVLRFERALARCYPALSRALGPDEVQSLAHELVAAHPFFPGSDVDLSEILSPYLAVALEDDRRRGAWLAELARLDEACEAVRRDSPETVGDELAGSRLLSFEHRVDVLREELLAGGAWREPAPQPVLLAVVAGPDGPRSVELAREPWSATGATGLVGTMLRGPHSAPTTPPKPSAA